LEEVKWIEDFLDKNAEDSLFWHINLAFTEFHSLEVTQGFIADTTRVGVGRAKDIVG
jgi:hypothetical protein